MHEPRLLTFVFRSGAGCDDLLQAIDQRLQALYPERKRGASCTPLSCGHRASIPSHPLRLRRPTVYELLLGEDEQERLEFLTSHGGRVRTVQPDYQVAGRTRLSVEMRPDVYERYRSTPPPEVERKGLLNPSSPNLCTTGIVCTMASCLDRSSSTSELAALFMARRESQRRRRCIFGERSTETNSCSVVVLCSQPPVDVATLAFIGGLLPPPTRRVERRAAAVTFKRI